MTQHIKAFVRLRPQEAEPNITLLPSSPNTLVVTRTGQQFTYEGVFDQHSTNQEVFSQVCPGLIEQSLQGRNICILAYGQTSTGKSHTILGDEHNPGLIPLCIEEYFKRLANKDLTFVMKVSYIEIYMENIRDLLTGGKADCKGGQLVGAEERLVRSISDAYAAFNAGEANRKTAKTGVNNSSSRSHAVFRILLEVRSLVQQDICTRAEINLADLAGSEAISKTGAQGLLKREGEAINKSLLALSNVVRSLSERTGFVNFRDSKLTRLLKSSLEGKSITSIICTLSTAASNLAESLNTLKFGLNAGAIQFTPTIEEEPHSLSHQNVSPPTDTVQQQAYNKLKLELQTAHQLHSELKKQLQVADARVEEAVAQRQRWQSRAQQAEMKAIMVEQNNMDLLRRIKQLNEVIKRTPSVSTITKMPNENSRCQDCDYLSMRLAQTEKQLQETMTCSSIQTGSVIRPSPIKKRVCSASLQLSTIELVAQKEMLEAQVLQMKRRQVALECEKDRLEDKLLEARMEGQGKGVKNWRQGQLGKLSKRLLHMRGLLARYANPE